MELQLGAGVPQGAGRENPSGVAAGPSPDLSVPNSVPFVAPVKGFTQFEPSTGALELAQSIGNINFGALATGFQQRNETKRKLQEEADRAAGAAETAKLLSQTGMDYATLIKSGKIPATSSPAFMLGGSYAASQFQLAKLREAVAKRRIDNPDAPVFTEDAGFLAPFYGALNGVRNEAVVKNFIEPMQALAQDDGKAHIKFYDTQAQQKFMGEAIGTAQKSIGLGDEPGAALNNAINVLQLGNHKTPENMETLITSIGPSIIDRATNKDTGKVDVAAVRQTMMDLAKTKVFAEGNRPLAASYLGAYQKLEDFVYGTVTKAANADKLQQEAAIDDATKEHFKWLSENFSSTTPEEQIQHGLTLGLPYDNARSMSAGWDSLAGNKSKEEITQSDHEMEYLATARDMTPSQRKSAMDMLLKAHREHTWDGSSEEWLQRFSALDKADKEAHHSAGVNGSDKGKITDTIYNQMSSIFGSTRSMNAALMGATGRYGLPAAATDRVRHIISERLTDSVMNWMVATGNLGSYQAAQENIQSDPGGPSRVMTQLTNQFLTTNAAQLSTLIPKALASGNPDAALTSLRLGATGPTSRVYNGARVSSQSVNKPLPTHPTTPAAHPQVVAREVAATRTNLLDSRTDIFHWFAANRRLNSPNLTDAQILKQLQDLPPVSIRQLQELFKKEQH